MNLFKQLWNDESGAVLSAETVLLGTVAVAGISTGMTAVSRAVNDELTEVALSIRSLDQSYSFHGFNNGCACTAGSCFKQQDVEKSREEIALIGFQHSSAQSSESTSGQPTPANLPDTDADN